MELDHSRLLRVVTISLAGCVAFFGAWMYIDTVSPMPPMDQVGPHGFALLFRVGVAVPSATAAAGLAFLAARFCWPVAVSEAGQASEESA